MEKRKMFRVGSVELDPELAVIFNEPVKKQYGCVEFMEKPSKHNVRHEVLKIHMRRNYPTPAMRSDLVGAMTHTLRFSNPPYFQHKKVDQKKNMRRAQEYLQYLAARRGFENYHVHYKKMNAYRDIYNRMRYSLKNWIKELHKLWERADHVHFLLEILFIKNLQQYPLPRRWITLIAYYHGMPEYERLIAAIRVITEYDGDRAPEFQADMF